MRNPHLMKIGIELVHILGIFIPKIEIGMWINWIKKIADGISFSCRESQKIEAKRHQDFITAGSFRIYPDRKTLDVTNGDTEKL